MSAAPCGDELRIRYLLTTRGVSYAPQPPLPDLETTVPEPITPTRVIPAAELPPRPPLAGEVPPWRTPPPPPPPPPPSAAPAPETVHRHIHEVVLVPTEPEPAPDPTWGDRTRTALHRVGRPWQLLLALAATVAPVLPHRYSLAVTWMYCVHQVRLQHGQGWAYGLALGAVALAATAVARRGGILRIFLLALSLFGILGAASLYDPITWITGVHL